MNQISELIKLNLIIPGPLSLFPAKGIHPIQAQSPTPTPMSIPPSAGPNWVQLMVGVVLIAVLIVIVGVWINRKESKD